MISYGPFYETLLKKNINDRNHLETVWLLYLRKKLFSQRLPSTIIKSIIGSDNDLAKVMLFEEYKKYISKTSMKALVDSACSWLLCYQMFLDDRIDKKQFEEKTGIHRNIAFYSTLKRKGFSFYK